MSGVPSEELKRYFTEARRWDQDRLASALQSRRLAWAAAGVAAALAISATAAVTFLTPLKTSEPFVIRVDRTTGSVDVVRGLSDEDGPIRYDEAVSKYFLGQYVRGREGYLDPAAEDAFRQVSILSAPSEQRRWADLYRGSNPTSPQNLYGPEAEAVIAIELLMAAQGCDFHAPLRSSQHLENARATLRAKVPMLQDDRHFHPDMEAANALIRSGALIASTGADLPTLA